MPEKQKILADLRAHLNGHFDGTINEVILFGSQARGDSGKGSDYDILIVLDNEYTSRDERKLMDLCYDIDLKYDIIIDGHILSSSELNSIRGKQPIFLNVLRTGIRA